MIHSTWMRSSYHLISHTLKRRASSSRELSTEEMEDSFDDGSWYKRLNWIELNGIEFRLSQSQPQPQPQPVSVTSLSFNAILGKAYCSTELNLEWLLAGARKCWGRRGRVDSLGLTHSRMQSSILHVRVAWPLNTCGMNRIESNWISYFRQHSNPGKTVLYEWIQAILEHVANKYSIHAYVYTTLRTRIAMDHFQAACSCHLSEIKQQYNKNGNAQIRQCVLYCTVLP